MRPVCLPARLQHVLFAVHPSQPCAAGHAPPQPVLPAPCATRSQSQLPCHPASYPEGSWADRKAAALQAYHEWMPTRPPIPANPAAFNRAFQFGERRSPAVPAGVGG